MSHTAAGKVGGPKEASVKGSSGDLYLQPDLRGQDVEAGLQGSWKEQTGLCKAQSRLKHDLTRLDPTRNKARA